MEVEASDGFARVSIVKVMKKILELVTKIFFSVFRVDIGQTCCHELPFFYNADLIDLCISKFS